MSEPVLTDPHQVDRERSTHDRNQSSPQGTVVNRLPMYDLLVSRLNERLASKSFSLGPDYVMKLSTILSSLGPDQAEQLALLLVHHYFLLNPTGPNPFVPKTTGRGAANRLPYEIKMSTGKGFSFDPASLPPPFQALIGTFCSL